MKIQKLFLHSKLQALSLKKTAAIICLLLILINNKSHAQLGDSALISVNIQLRHYFSGVNYSSPDVRLFYDHAAHFVSPNLWDNYNQQDTLNENLWSVIYEEMWWSQFDTTNYERVDEFYDHIDKVNYDTVDIGFILMNYYQLLDSTVLFDSTYYYYDTVGNHLVDNPNRISAPYEQKRVFVGTVFKSGLNAEKTVFRINPQNFLFDSLTDGFSGDKDSRLYTFFIDFGDNVGYQEIDPHTLDYIVVEFDSNNNGGGAARAAVVNNLNGDTIDFTQFVIEWDSNLLQNVELPTILTDDYPGIEVGIFSSCTTDDEPELGEKYIIYVEGFDFFNQLGVRSHYSDVFQETSLAELRNYGYNVAIVNWKHPGDAIQDNAARLVNFIDDLKCQLSPNDIDTLHQFVVIGESMGGVVARYALLWMEANQNQLNCRPQLLHNTRLFISLDAPQDGAYIPMAFQELYNQNKLLTFLSYATRNEYQNRWDMLNCEAARGLLKYHQTTNPFHTLPTSNNFDAVYSEAPIRDNVMDEMFAMNATGYPLLCKKIAISRGLLTGERLTNAIGEEAIPGQAYLRGDGQLVARVLWMDLELMSVDLNLSSLDGTSNDFFHFEKGLRFWKLVFPTMELTVGWCPFCYKIRIPNGLPSFQMDYVLDREHRRFSTTTRPWDVMPGGYYNILGFQNGLQNAINNGFNIEGAEMTGNGFEVVADDFDAAWGVNVDLIMELDKFNFIPIQSALDYQIPSQPDPLERDIYNENINLKLSRTPFDVITGEINGLGGYPQVDVRNSYARNEYRYPSHNQDHLSNLRNHRRNDFLTNSTLGSFTNPLYVFYLNREIGDEELLLENYRFPETSLFEAEYRIFAGTQLNPYYEYPNMPAQEVFAPYDINSDPTFVNNGGYNLDNNGIFSKEETFEAAGGFAILKAEDIIDDNVNGGMNGPSIHLLQPQFVCVLDFWCFPDDTCTNKRGALDSINIQNQIEYVEPNLFPNPVLSSQAIEINTHGQYYNHISMVDINGRVVFNTKLEAAYQQMNIDLGVLNIPSGMYLLKLVHPDDIGFSTLKIIVQ